MNQDTQNQTPGQEPVKYATPIQRVWAWVGVVYMLLLLFLTTYGVAHGGAFLRGIGGMMLSPALVGLGITVILRYRAGQGRGGLPVCALLSGLAFLLAAWGLLRDLPTLLAQLRGVNP